jgi:hypothetical protein
MRLVDALAPTPPCFRRRNADVQHSAAADRGSCLDRFGGNASLVGGTTLAAATLLLLIVDVSLRAAEPITTPTTDQLGTPCACRDDTRYRGRCHADEYRHREEALHNPR